MNPLYELYKNGQAIENLPTNRTPLQAIDAIQRAMANPGAFIKEKFPDIPENIMNSPILILDYLQRTRGMITNQQIQQLVGLYGGNYVGH